MFIERYYFVRKVQESEGKLHNKTASITDNKKSGQENLKRLQEALPIITMEMFLKIQVPFNSCPE